LASCQIANLACHLFANGASMRPAEEESGDNNFILINLCLKTAVSGQPRQHKRTLTIRYYLNVQALLNSQCSCTQSPRTWHSSCTQVVQFTTLWLRPKEEHLQVLHLSWVWAAARRPAAAYRRRRPVTQTLTQHSDHSTDDTTQCHNTVTQHSATTQ